MTAGFMLELTAAYSTFILCGKAERTPLVHGVPYAFALAGATFLYLAPDFRNAVEASLVYSWRSGRTRASRLFGSLGIFSWRIETDPCISAPRSISSFYQPAKQK